MTQDDHRAKILFNSQLPREPAGITRENSQTHGLQWDEGHENELTNGCGPVQ